MPGMEGTFLTGGEVLCRLDLRSDHADLTFRIRTHANYPTGELVSAISARPGVREVGLGQD